MHKLLIIPVFLAFAFGCFSVNAQKTGNALTVDEEQAGKWFDYAQELEGKSMDSAAHYYLKAGALSDKINYYDGKMRFAFGYSFVLNSKSNFSESEKILRGALALARSKDDALNIAKSLVNIGNVFNYKGSFDSAYVYYLEAIPFLQRAEATRFLDILYSNIGVLLQNAGRNDEALLYYDKGLKVAHELGDSSRIAAVLNNKGIVLNNVNRFEEATDIFQQALMYAENDKAVAGSSYSNLGNTYQLLGKNALALENYQKSLVIFQQLGDFNGLGMALMGFAIVYSNQKQFQKAEEYAEKALPYFEEQPGSLLGLLKLLADVKNNLGKHAESYDYFTKYITLQKEVQSQEIQETISEAEKKYQLAQKEEELAVKELQLTKSKLENRKKQFYLIITSVLILAMGGISFLFSRNIRQRNKLFAIERDNLQKEKEMSVLKATVEGAHSERSRIAKEMHDDLGTGLTSIRFLAERMDDSEKGFEYAQKIRQSARDLTDQMNEIVWSMDAGSDSLEELVIYIRSKIGGFLEANEIDFTFHTSEEIPDFNLSGRFRRNVYLTLKEAVNNAVKHSGTSRIKIRLDASPDLSISVQDFGCGITPGMKSGGHGLRNMQARIEELNGHFEIRGNQDGTLISIRLPYEQA